jgi:hypothetical protein
MIITKLKKSIILRNYTVRNIYFFGGLFSAVIVICRVLWRFQVPGSRLVAPQNSTKEIFTVMLSEKHIAENSDVLSEKNNLFLRWCWNFPLPGRKIFLTG